MMSPTIPPVTGRPNRCRLSTQQSRHPQEHNKSDLLYLKQPLITQCTLEFQRIRPSHTDRYYTNTFGRQIVMVHHVYHVNPQNAITYVTVGVSCTVRVTRLLIAFLTSPLIHNNMFTHIVILVLLR
jgi:hypothetical protein